MEVGDRGLPREGAVSSGYLQGHRRLGARRAQRDRLFVVLLAFLFEHRLATRDGLAIAMVAWSSTLVVNVAITAIAQR